MKLRFSRTDVSLLSKGKGDAGWMLQAENKDTMLTWKVFNYPTPALSSSPEWVFEILSRLLQNDDCAFQKPTAQLFTSRRKHGNANLQEINNTRVLTAMHNKFERLSLMTNSKIAEHRPIILFHTHTQTRSSRS